MHQNRLFRLAVESGAVTFRHVPGVGWSLVVAARRGDESWRDVSPDYYHGLSTQELLDTLYASLDAIL